MRGHIWMLLLLAANAHNFLWVLGAVDEDKVKKQLNRMEMDQNMDFLHIKSLISRILQANDKIADRLEKLEQLHKETQVCESLPGIDKESHMTTIINKLQQMEQTQNKSNGRIDEMNTHTKNVLGNIEKVEATLELVNTRVQDNAHLIKALLTPECDRWLKQTRNLNRSNFFSAEGKQFYFNKTTYLAWNKTRDWCAERGMEMAILKTSSQMDAVTTELRERKADDVFYWLDASDRGQKGGKFRWVDGTLVDGTTWNRGKIYKIRGDWNETTCVQFGPAIARLGDEKCSTSLPILCQVPAALAACL